MTDSPSPKLRSRIRIGSKAYTYREIAISAALMIAAAAAMGYAFTVIVGQGQDWDALKPFAFDWDVFRGAIFDVLAGRNPYQVDRDYMLFYNPPWALIPLLPLAFLPRMIGVLVLAILSIFTMIAVARKLGHGVLGAVLIAVSAMHVEGMGHGQIEFLPWLGLFMPLPIAMLFFTIKPQTTIGIMLLLLWREYRQKGWQAVIKAIAPTAVLGMLTILFWGLPQSPERLDVTYFWVFKTILLGLPTLIYAFKRNHDDPTGIDPVAIAAAAGPLIGPYTIFHSYLSVLFPFKKLWLLIPLVIASYLIWVFVLT